MNNLVPGNPVAYVADFDDNDNEILASSILERQYDSLLWFTDGNSCHAHWIRSILPQEAN